MMRLITKISAMVVWSACVLRAEPVALDTDALATLAVQDHGRKKPFTTFAQETLLTVSGTSALPFKNADGTEVKLSPEEVMLDLWFKSEGWLDRPVIMLNFLELKKKFGLPEDRKLFSFKELIGQPVLGELLDETQKLRQAGDSDKPVSYTHLDVYKRQAHGRGLRARAGDRRLHRGLHFTFAFFCLVQGRARPDAGHIVLALSAVYGKG